MNAPIKIGVLGGGMMAQIGHLPYYSSDPRCILLRVCESRPSLVEALSQTFGNERIINDWESLLADRDIDAVVISAPRPATGPLTLAALKAGKHVFAEKPMAHTVEQARQLVDAASAQNLTYAVGFMRRYDPGIQSAKVLFDQMAADGSLGNLLFARFYNFSSAYVVPLPAHVRPKESRAKRFPTWPLYPSWLPDRYYTAYAWFTNMGSHDLNLLRYFFPHDVDVVRAYSTDHTSVVATLRTGETPITLEIAKSSAGRWLQGAEFLFERGRIDLVLPSPMAANSVGAVTLDDAHRGIVGKRIEADCGWSFARQASGFIDVLCGNATPLTTGEEGLADMILTEQIWRRVVASG